MCNSYRGELTITPWEFKGLRSLPEQPNTKTTRSKRGSEFIVHAQRPPSIYLWTILYVEKTATSYRNLLKQTKWSTMCLVSQQNLARSKSVTYKFLPTRSPLYFIKYLPHDISRLTLRDSKVLLSTTIESRIKVSF